MNRSVDIDARNSIHLALYIWDQYNITCIEMTNVGISLDHGIRYDFCSSKKQSSASVVTDFRSILNT